MKVLKFNEFLNEKKSFQEDEIRDNCGDNIYESFGYIVEALYKLSNVKKFNEKVDQYLDTGDTEKEFKELIDIANKYYKDKKNKGLREKLKEIIFKLFIDDLDKLIKEKYKKQYNKDNYYDNNLEILEEIIIECSIEYFPDDENKFIELAEKELEKLISGCVEKEKDKYEMGDLPLDFMDD